MKKSDELKSLIESFVGRRLSGESEEFAKLKFFSNKMNIGYSQFNEILLLLGCKRITKTCFQFLVDQTTEYKIGSTLRSFEELEKGVTEFRKLSIFLYANVRYGFNLLARDASELIYHLNTLRPIDEAEFRCRHKPILPIDSIPANDTPLLGYLVKGKIEKEIKSNPKDRELNRKKEKMEEIIIRGKRNQQAYLASDHLDVYVATSMRENHEYISVNKTIKEISNHGFIKELNLRWFDPTQAYCEDRVDKGLAEGLMLKRAKCTIYLAQESDTLGKDSELASTLAQGKPVIALVPRGDKQYVDELIRLLEMLHPKRTKTEIMLDQLKVFNPGLAWGNKPINKSIRKWLSDVSLTEEEKLINELYKTVSEHYDKRAKMLKEKHPLGIQVDIEMGVATGVLVVRSIDDCARLVRSIVLKELDFDLSTTKKRPGNYTYLKEKISGCIYRVVTGDPILTNTFWNFYIDIPNEDTYEDYE